MTSDVVVDCLYEENLQAVLKTLGSGRLVMDKDDPSEPYLTPEDGYLIVRIRDRDPHVFARELERRVPAMRVVTIVNRTPGEQGPTVTPPPVPGSYQAQRQNGVV